VPTASAFGWSAVHESSARTPGGGTEGGAAGQGEPVVRADGAAAGAAARDGTPAAQVSVWEHGEGGVGGMHKRSRRRGRASNGAAPRKH
jgi:hypothetical protein